VACFQGGREFFVAHPLRIRDEARKFALGRTSARSCTICSSFRCTSPTSRRQNPKRHSRKRYSFHLRVEKKSASRRVMAMDELKRGIDAAEYLLPKRRPSCCPWAVRVKWPISANGDAAFPLEHLTPCAPRGVTICVETHQPRMGAPSYLRAFVERNPVSPPPLHLISSTPQPPPNCAGR